MNWIKVGALVARIAFLVLSGLAAGQGVEQVLDNQMAGEITAALIGAGALLMEKPTMDSLRK